MKAIDFAYWLQGHFELQGDTAPLTPAQAKIIHQKTETVKAGEGEAEAKAQSFVSFAQGLLLMAVQNSQGQNPQGEALKFVSDNLRTKLNDLFIHAIDPTIQGDQQQLRRTHRPNGDNGGLVGMC